MRLHWGCLDRSGCKVKRHKNNKFFGESSGALLVASSYLRLKCDWKFIDKWLNFDGHMTENMIEISSTFFRTHDYPITVVECLGMYWAFLTWRTHHHGRDKYVLLWWQRYSSALQKCLCYQNMLQSRKHFNHASPIKSLCRGCFGLFGAPFGIIYI
jgi:hypothetical protein